MKNNTKIRLHLSKQLFESLAKQVLTEAKTKQNLGAGMEEVKVPKEKKDKEPKTEAVPGAPKAPAAPSAGGTKTASASTLAKDFRKKAQSVATTKGLSSQEVLGLQKIIDTVLAKAGTSEIGVAIQKAQKILDGSTANVKPAVAEMETRVDEDIDPEFLKSFLESLAIIGSVIGGSAFAIKKYVTSIAKEAMKKHPEKFQGLDVNNPADVKKVADKIGSSLTSSVQKSTGGTGGAGIGGQSSKA